MVSVLAGCDVAGLYDGAVALVATNYKQVYEIDIFAVVSYGAEPPPSWPPPRLRASRDRGSTASSSGALVEARIAAKAAVILPQSRKVMTNVIEPAKPADKVEAAQ